jgi:hypothetical protein
VLLGLFFAVKAWSYGLDRYLLLYGDNGVAGAQATPIFTLPRAHIEPALERFARQPTDSVAGVAGFELLRSERNSHALGAETVPLKLKNEAAGPERLNTR